MSELITFSILIICVLAIYKLVTWQIKENNDRKEKIRKFMKTLNKKQMETCVELFGHIH